MTLPGTPGVDLTRRPSLTFLGWATILGLALGLGCAALIYGLLAEPSWLLAGVTGTILGALVPLSVAGGSRVTIHQGRLTYFLRGQPCVEADLQDIQGFRAIAQGQLTGVGVVIEPQKLRFLSRKGVTLRTCEAHFAGSGCGLVLEFLTPDDIPALTRGLSHET